MTVTIKPNNFFAPIPGQPSLAAGTIVTDATGITPVTTASISASANITTAITSTSGILTGEWYDFAGAGVAAGSWRTKVKAVGAQVTFEGNAPTAAVLTAFTGCAYIPTFFRPRYVKLFNITTPGTYEWIDGMPPNTSIQTTGVGVISQITGGAISTESQGFLLGTTILPVSSTFYYIAFA